MRTCLQTHESTYLIGNVSFTTSNKNNVRKRETITNKNINYELINKLLFTRYILALQDQTTDFTNNFWLSIIQSKNKQFRPNQI